MLFFSRFQCHDHKKFLLLQVDLVKLMNDDRIGKEIIEKYKQSKTATISSGYPSRNLCVQYSSRRHNPVFPGPCPQRE